jgi:hypothetical protein
LTVYLVNKGVDDPKAILRPGSKHHKLRVGAATADLYVKVGDPHPPKWLSFFDGKFLDTIDHAVPQRFDVHLVLDNYGTHKTPMIHRWLVKRPRFHLHFTPTGTSWINQVERWFALPQHMFPQNTVETRNCQSRSPSHQVLGGSHPGGGEIRVPRRRRCREASRA